MLTIYSTSFYKIGKMAAKPYWALRACSYGKKLSRLARKHFDKLTSEISPSCENSMKIYLAFIRDEKFSHVARSCLLIGEISVHGEILDSYERNLFNTLPLSGKSVPYEQDKIHLASRNVFSLTGIIFSHMNRPLGNE